MAFGPDGGTKLPDVTCVPWAFRVEDDGRASRCQSSITPYPDGTAALQGRVRE